MTLGDKVVFWMCTHCLAVLTALLLYKKYFPMGMC